jgi:hypothetical protein
VRQTYYNDVSVHRAEAAALSACSLSSGRHARRAALAGETDSAKIEIAHLLVGSVVSNYTPEDRLCAWKQIPASVVASHIASNFGVEEA